MKLSKWSRYAALSVCAVMLLWGSMFPVLAVSPSNNWMGVERSGVLIADEDTPIVVEKERLTFDLQEFPKDNYRKIEDFQTYTGSFTAEYTFYNPSEHTVTTKLLLPFGRDPRYAGFFAPGPGVQIDNADIQRYGVLVNGEAVEKTLRHTLAYYSYSYGEFDAEDALSYLHDGFVDYGFFMPDLPVTKYVFQVSGVAAEQYNSAYAGFDIPSGLDDCRIYLREGSYRLRAPADASVACNDGELVLYAIGKPFASLPEWKVYQDSFMNDEEIVDGKVELVTTQTMTFKDFALSNWNVQTGVSELDWYNAVVEEMEPLFFDRSYPVVTPEAFEKAFDGALMRWYEYEITLAPGERIVNTVIAPIYPSIISKYEPDVFSYTYLLSPAKAWKSFDELEIVINTPFYLVGSGIEGFVRNEQGYTATLDGLPDGELKFSLCASETPELTVAGLFNHRVSVWKIVVVVFIIGFVAVGAVWLSRKNRGVDTDSKDGPSS